MADFESKILWDLASRLERRMAAAGMETFLSHDGHGTPTDEAYVTLLYQNVLARVETGDEQGANALAYLREIVARTKLLDCRTHERTWEILRLTKMPVALIDVGYITNSADAALLNDPQARDTIAEAILVAVKRVYLLGENDQPTGTYTFADLLAAEGTNY